ncbi:MAG: phosphoglycerate dehydrogenase [Nitrospira sp. SG-bin2]|uniref:phosphoglycerate dehydrogenase n=1 Tax=Nitrospira cf. moscoviensis SBR1015 TaxID=96242 RepID=UPI000A0AF52B|nr:phosphoglycerate dehydrogenase [Nitrospira cf. moscoviensis SBR1015]OQW32152.1 MAG: phosphoglycerate dehydrogenase [Nitrospira sp. SG-bin2]
MRVLITCPPMLGKIHDLRHLFDQKQVDMFCPAVVQTLSEDELVGLVPQFDGWIIGDDPATRRVFEAGKKGLLKAAVKWGVGVDNVDFTAANDLAIPVTNTPNMFGGEVGDVAMSYITALARETFLIDREVRLGKWPKRNGISLAGKTLGLVGLGDIGKATARRVLAADMRVIAYDPIARPSVKTDGVELAVWPERVEECDFIVLTCSLNEGNRHMLNAGVFSRAKRGVRIVNVARGALIAECDLIDALEDGTVHSAALDVFEAEPLPMSSPLRQFERCILGSHNGSNTADAVMRTSERAVGLLFKFLEVR